MLMPMIESQSQNELDAVDWQLLDELQRDARLSYNELARRVHLSAPSVAARVRRLERGNVITGYRAQVSPAASGQPLAAFVQLRCSLGACLLKTTRAEQFPEIVEIHKLSGEHCSMLKIRATSLGHFEGVLEELGKHGAMNTHIVLSTQYEDTTVREPQPTRRPVSRSQGWSTPER
jgi:Lrp/AsnC family transcriptional regulator, leucine-responsive regulatory protein